MTDPDENSPDNDGKSASVQENQGEGNYEAARRFDEAEKTFVEKNKDAIPGLAKAAADALDGPEGDELRAAAEATKLPMPE